MANNTLLLHICDTPLFLALPSDSDDWSYDGELEGFGFLPKDDLHCCLDPVLMSTNFQGLDAVGYLVEIVDVDFVNEFYK